MKEGNYCLYTCGRAKNCGGEFEGSDNADNADNAAGSQRGSVKPGDRTVCNDIQPPGEYTCQQQVRT